MDDKYGILMLKRQRNYNNVCAGSAVYSSMLGTRPTAKPADPAGEELGSAPAAAISEDRVAAVGNSE